MAVLLRTIGLWLAKKTLDELIEETSDPDITGETSRKEIMEFIEKKDISHSEMKMWGLLDTYNEIFKEANILLYFRKITGDISMGGMAIDAPYPNLHKLWEMIVGKKIFTSQWHESHPVVHPEVRALLKAQMILLIEYVGLSKDTALARLEKYWPEELRREESYFYGHYWETPCCFLAPREVSLNILKICKRDGRMWDGAEIKWYSKIRKIYKEEILDKASNKSLDPIPRELKFPIELLQFFKNPVIEYEAVRIDANGDWFNEDVERSAQELWKILKSRQEWPGWVKARGAFNAPFDVKVPLIPKQ